MTSGVLRGPGVRGAYLPGCGQAPLELGRQGDSSAKSIRASPGFLRILSTAAVCKGGRPGDR